jgi:drug/metabolite transporter (DMT)-like permease
MNFVHRYSRILLNKLERAETKFSSLIGYIYCLLANLCSSLRNLYVRKGFEIPHYQLHYFRVLSLTFIMYFVLRSQKEPLVNPSKKINILLIFIGFFGLLAGASSFYGFQVIPLNEASVIFQTQPVISSILAVIVLKESFDLVQYISVVLCTAGVLLVAKPSFLFGEAETTSHQTIHRLSGTISLLFAASMNGIQSILVKRVVAFVNSNLSVFYIGLIPTLFGGLLILFAGVAPMNYNEWLITLNIVIYGILAQVLYNRSFKFGYAGKLSIMGYSQIIFGFILDFFILNSVPDIYSLIGAILVFSCVLLRLYKTMKDES